MEPRVRGEFYSHVNYSVTKIEDASGIFKAPFYSHVNYSVTKIPSVFFLRFS